MGDNGQSKTFQKDSQTSAELEVEKKVRSKEKKGYRENQFVDSSSVSPTTVKSVASGNLESIAQNQIRYKNKNVATLVSYLTKVNAHNISSATGGRITFNDTTGLFSTEQGVVTLDTIDGAAALLEQIGDLVSKKDYGSSIVDLTNE
jgi:hypothetical protein